MPETISTAEAIVKAIEEGVKTASDGISTTVRVTALRLWLEETHKLRLAENFLTVMLLDTLLL